MRDDLWRSSRSGSHAGRGFRYQDAVATELAVRAWRGELPLERLVPEGLEDVSLERDAGWLHLQVKSRRAHRGAFGPAELAPALRQLAERLAADPAARAGLVLEPALAGVTPGLDHMLADSDSDELKRAVADAVEGTIDADDFLARTCVLVMPTPVEVAVSLLAEQLRLPPASCVAHQAILCSRLAALADENGVRSADVPAALSIGDVGRLLDDVSEAIDPSALEEAVREGIAEAVDFATATDDPRFFGGVDVGPGHVVAGLPLERPETEQLAEALSSQRVTLAVGPSGAGKSALIWLAAHATRHRVRWYRVRRLRDGDVPALVRLVKGLGPSGAEVGFVVDDLGREDRAGFDHLVEELREEHAACVLGACREEDLFVVRTAPTVAQVRPRLDPGLAERIWRELRDRDSTAWPAWREAYERSEGLLLEYGHLLTEGERLAQTVAAQVQCRVRERRALELGVLALVATADTFGAELDTTRLTAALGAETVDMRAALSRLADEHLVSERDGMLGGLHELRSRHVMEEIHRLPPPTLASSVERVIELLTGAALQPFVLRLLLAEAVEDDVVLDAIAARLEREPDPLALAAALHALRLVGFSRMAPSWRAVFEAEGVAPTHAPLVAHLVLNDAEIEIFPAPVQRAVARLRDIAPADLRDRLLERCAQQVPEALTAAPDVRSAATVLAALGEVGRTVPIEPVAVVSLLGEGAPLADVRLLLEAAYAAAPELAVAVADALGGSAALLERLERERPWVRGAHLGVDQEGRSTAEAEYVFVAESAQRDPHAAVVELARYLAALAPAAQVAVCRAIDATGKVAGLKVPIADKAIDRRALPSQAAIAWNRARMRAAIAAVATRSETEHQLAARELIARAAKLLRDAGKAWARGRAPTEQLVGDAIALADAANRLAPPPIAIEADGPLEDGELPMSDPAGFVGSMIPNNLFLRLFKGERVAPVIPQILNQVDALIERDCWRLIEAAPLNDLAALRQTLVDLHSVLSERDSGNREAASALARAGRNGLPKAAHLARQRAANRIQRIADELEATLGSAGFPARVLRRPGETDSPVWPNNDVLVLVEVSTILHWQHGLETVLAICRPALRNRISFLLAPVRDGHIAASYGVKAFEQSAYPSDEVRTWPTLPLPLLNERLGSAVGRALWGLREASGILASLRRDELHDEETAALEQAVDRARVAMEEVPSLAEEHDEVLVEVHDALMEYSERLKDEADALRRGERVERTLAASLISGLNGEPDELLIDQAGVVAMSLEWDVNPAGVCERIERASEELGKDRRTDGAC